MRFSVTHPDRLCRSGLFVGFAALLLTAVSLVSATSADAQAASQAGNQTGNLAATGRTAVPQQPRKAQDALTPEGLTMLVAAASTGDVSSVKSLLSAGAAVDATDASGRTALIAAIQSGQVESAKTLIAAGADLNLEARYLGTPLNVAENAGDSPLAAFLISAGAHSTGKSVGDSVCVQPWSGEGFCGTVKSFTVRAVQLDVTRIVGCAGGCPARQECSAQNPVGGTNGLHVGEQIAVPSWCLTRTGVSKSEASSTAAVSR